MRLITQLHIGKRPIAKRDQSVIQRFVVFALHTLPVRSIEKAMVGVRRSRMLVANQASQARRKSRWHERCLAGPTRSAA